MKRRILPPAIGFAYIAVIAVLGGLRSDHVLIGLLGLLDLYNEKTRLFLAQFLQTAQGYGPLGAGLRLLPWTAALFVVAPIAGALVNRITSGDWSLDTDLKH